jgi:hypothetical protein
VVERPVQGVEDHILIQPGPQLAPGNAEPDHGSGKAGRQSLSPRVRISSPPELSSNSSTPRSGPTGATPR